jgi:hypothetical protein
MIARIADVLRPLAPTPKPWRGSCQPLSVRWSRGSDPRLLRLTLDTVPDRAFGERPRGSKAISYLKARLSEATALVLLCHLLGTRERLSTPNASERSSYDLLINSLDGLSHLGGSPLIHQDQPAGANMAKRRIKSKVQKRGKLPRGNSAKHGKARKSLRAKAANRMVATAKPKRAAAQKAARRVKQPVAPAIEAVVVDVVEEPVSGGTEAN